jgi:nucleoside diphosphate kinase
MSLQQLMEADQLSLTIYSPETIKSKLEGHIDQHIHKMTAAIPVYRFNRHLTSEKIAKFYSKNESPKPPFVWDAIFELFQSGSSIVTLWKGKEMINSLLEVKGKTHPSKAIKESIRGRFWCDSSLCNLMHSSDSLQEMERELTVLGGLEYLKEQPQKMEFLPSLALNINNTNHSGIIFLCRIIIKYLQNKHRIELILPEPLTDSSLDANLCYSEFLQHLYEWQYTPLKIKNVIRLYLDGDPKLMDILPTFIPLTNWEKLIIRCSVNTRTEWNNVLKTI